MRKELPGKRAPAPGSRVFSRKSATLKRGITQDSRYLAGLARFSGDRSIGGRQVYTNLSGAVIFYSMGGSGLESRDLFEYSSELG